MVSLVNSASEVIGAFIIVVIIIIFFYPWYLWSRGGFIKITGKYENIIIINNNNIIIIITILKGHKYSMAAEMAVW